MREQDFCTLVLWFFSEPKEELGAPTPWSFVGSSATSTTLRLGVERRRHLCAGDVKTPTILVKLLSGKRDQGDPGCVHERDLIAGKRYSS